jgi:hypothetical protein
MRRLILALCSVALLLPQQVQANYCPPDRPAYSEYRPAPGQRSDTDGRWWIITILLVALAFLLGKSLSPGPSKQDVVDAINGAFNARTHEADVHARKKLPKPLEEARKGTLKALEKLKIIDPGWK